MKRLVLLAVLAVGVGLAVVALAPKLVSIEVVRRAISREVAGWNGRSLAFDGTPSIAFSPYLTVTFPNVTIASNRSDEPLVSMDRLSAQVPILPLLFGGRIEPSAFDFIRPMFHLSIGPDGQPNWDLPAGLDETSRLSQLTITDGTIEYDDATGRRERLESINAVLAWPSPSDPTSFYGSAAWRGETAHFYVSIDTLDDFRSGLPATARIVLESEALRGAYDGSAQKLGGLTGRGRLSLSTPSLGRVFRLLGHPMPEDAGLGSLAIQSNAALARGLLGLDDAALTFDGNEAEGAVSFDLNGIRPAIQATLAFDSLDLSAYSGAISNTIDVARTAPDRPLDWPALDALDVDLRLSSERVRVGGRTLGRAAASAALRDGRLDLAIGEMQFQGGRVSASLSAEAGEKPSAALQARIDAMPLRAALGDLFGMTGLDGRAGATLNLSAAGGSWNELMGSLAGKGSVTVLNGSVRGIDFAAIAGAARAGDATARTGGSTRFSRARGDFTVHGDTVSARDASVEGSGYSVVFDAEASFREPDLLVRGTVSPSPAGGQPSGDGQEGVAVPFTVGGSLLSPEVGEDPPARSAP